ncbi:hypothetical protein BN1110_02676 [bacterium YEK0313]|nr:hypothetical protein BN1110_02676 [bacterium YEK0313]
MATPAPCAGTARRLHRADRPADDEASKRRRFLAVTGAVSLASFGATGFWCAAMPAMAGVPMPGGWVLTMPWIRLCGEGWAAAGTGFVAMWLVMMVAMMLPSLAPVLWRCRHAVGAASKARRGALMLMVATGYFTVWLAIGAVIFALGTALAETALRKSTIATLVPLAGAVVVLAGALTQFSAAKARHLACWRRLPGLGQKAETRPLAAFRDGLRIGCHCVGGSAGLTAILLVCGVMDLAAMTVLTAAITAERLAPGGEEVARATGAGAVGVGLVLTVQAVAALA